MCSKHIICMCIILKERVKIFYKWVNSSVSFVVSEKKKKAASLNFDFPLHLIGSSISMGVIPISSLCVPVCVNAHVYESWLCTCVWDQRAALHIISQMASTLVFVAGSFLSLVPTSSGRIDWLTHGWQRSTISGFIALELWARASMSVL